MKPIDFAYANNTMSREDINLIRGMENTAYVCGCRGEDVTFMVHKALKRMGRDDLLPPCERRKEENPIDKETNKLWMIFGFLYDDIIAEKTKQWIKETKEAGMTLTEYLACINPLNEAKKEK